MLHTVYYYNGKLCALRGGEHSNIAVANFDVGLDFIRFEDNLVKTFYGGFTDLKYEPRLVKHVSHPLDGKHKRCLDEIYYMFLGSVQACSNEVTAFYFKPNSKRFAFDKQPVGINTLQ